MTQKFDTATVTQCANNPSSNADDLYSSLKFTNSEKMNELSAHILSRLRDEFGQSNDLRFLLEEARLSHNFGQIDVTEKQLSAIQSRFPRNGHAYIRQSDILVERGEIESAKILLQSSWQKINEKKLQIEIVYRIIKLRSYQHAAATNAPLTSTTPLQEDHRAALVMMARDEHDIITENLEHHHRMGFRNFFIVDNNSRDGTSQIIEAFSESKKNSIVVRISDPVAGYFQGEKTTAAAQFAISYLAGIGRPVEWIFVLDADEFLSGPAPHSCLSDLLATAQGQGANFMAFALCDVAPREDHFFDNVKKDIYRDFPIVGSHPPRLVLKNAFRAEFRCRITTGNHVLDSDDLDPEKCLVGAEAGWKFVHMPYRSASQVARKILNGSAAIQARGDAADIGRHWIALGDEMRRDAEATANKKLDGYSKETLRHSKHDPRIFRL
jgi:hypothetical protein